MAINDLESMTYTFAMKEYTPINYILYFIDEGISLHSDDEREAIKSLILAQLPIIFKKYNLPLIRRDIQYFVGPNHNIASYDEMKNFIEESRDYDEYQLRQRDFCLEFYSYYVINFNPYNPLRSVQYKEKKSIDEYIKNEIIDRYEYYFDKGNPNGFNQFKNYMAEYIEKDNFKISDATIGNYKYLARAKKCKNIWYML